jgi:hypothetical protein
MLYGEEAALFAGYTTTPINGTIGSREQMHATCAAAFTGSHLCHSAELDLSNSASQPPVGGAWLDVSGAIGSADGNIGVSLDLAQRDVGRYSDQLGSWNCLNWSANTDGFNPTSGAIMLPSGPTSVLCTTTHVLACCSSPYKEKFAGFTTATTNGVVGGRAIMHQLCGAQFAGSHLCHGAEYQRAHSTTPPPTGGAWIDATGYSRTTGGANVDFSTASVRFGRYTGQLGSWNCLNWTANTDGFNPTSGAVETPTGETSVLCTTTHPLACCQ